MLNKTNRLALCYVYYVVLRTPNGSERRTPQRTPHATAVLLFPLGCPPPPPPSSLSACPTTAHFHSLAHAPLMIIKKKRLHVGARFATSHTTNDRRRARSRLASRASRSRPLGRTHTIARARPSRAPLALLQLYVGLLSASGAFFLLLRLAHFFFCASVSRRRSSATSRATVPSLSGEARPSSCLCHVISLECSTSETSWSRVASRSGGLGSSAYRGGAGGGRPLLVPRCTP